MSPADITDWNAPMIYHNQCGPSWQTLCPAMARRRRSQTPIAQRNPGGSTACACCRELLLPVSLYEIDALLHVRNGIQPVVFVFDGNVSFETLRLQLI